MTNATTVKLLQVHPLPDDLRPWRWAAKELPWNAVLNIIAQGSQNDMQSSEIGAALVAGAKFNRLKVHQCAACETWVRRKDARPLSTLVERTDDSKEIVFYAVCPTCDRRIEAGQVSNTMASKLRKNVFGE